MTESQFNTLIHLMNSRFEIIPLLKC